MEMIELKKKAIAHFKYGISHDIYSEPVLSYAKLAVEALGKQIPRRTDVYADGYADGHPVWETHCPLCGRDLDDSLSAYCPDCGQAIDWSE